MKITLPAIFLNRNQETPNNCWHSGRHNSVMRYALKTCFVRQKIGVHVQTRWLPCWTPKKLLKSNISVSGLTLWYRSPSFSVRHKNQREDRRKNFLVKTKTVDRRNSGNATVAHIVVCCINPAHHPKLSTTSTGYGVNWSDQPANCHDVKLIDNRIDVTLNRNHYREKIQLQPLPVFVTRPHRAPTKREVLAGYLKSARKEAGNWKQQIILIRNYVSFYF